LPDLLRQLGEATMGRARLDVSVAVDGQPARPLDAEVKLALYRIAQEGLNNIARHAHAGRASIELSYGPTGGVGLRLVDDGQGFDPDHIPAGHLGVRIMAERARAIGARLRVDSRPGHGTCLEVGWTPASE
jgi:signal transduction histidine kinase